MQTEYRQERIALVIGDLNSGGAQKQGEYIAHALLDMGKHLDIYYTNMTPIGEPRFRKLRERGARVQSFGERRGILPRTWALLQRLRANRPDVVLALRTYMNLYAGIACRVLRIPSAGSLRSSLVYEQADMGRLMWLACKLPNHMLVNSFNARDELAASDWVARDKIHVLENVIDIEDFDNRTEIPLLNVQKHVIDLYFVGRHIQTKRLDLLLQAFHQAYQQNDALHLTLVGDGDLVDELKSLALELNIAEIVTFLGYRHDAAALLQQMADILLLVSDEEGFPNVVIEAMSAEIPCIVTPAGDSPRIVEDGKHGLVVPHEDIEAIAEAILALANDPDRRQVMGAAGRYKVEKNYSYASLARRLEGLIGTIRGV